MPSVADSSDPDGIALMAKEKRPDAYSQVQARVGERIKWARELVEPNRAAFARAMGVDRSTLQKIEDGGRPPSIFNVIDIAHKLRVTPDYILKGSLKGVDGELAGMLVAQHPELAPGTDTAMDSGTYQPPRKPKRA
jgi:transcriptional regulator with XRE-family HTH domain